MYNLNLAQIFSQLEDMDLTLNFGSLGLIAYVLQALSLYTIAKRRGIHKPGLAWVPLVNVWILGSVSDQYQYVVNREIKNKRKTLLGLNIAQCVIVLLFFAALVWMVIDVLLLAGGTFAGWMDVSGEQDWQQMFGHLDYNLNAIFAVIALTIPLIGVAISYTIVFWMAVYDLFRSCDPKNSTLYLVISIVGGMMLEGLHSVFMLVCREKDAGMPPRKPEPEPVAPAVEPWEDI